MTRPKLPAEERDRKKREILAEGGYGFLKTAPYDRATQRLGFKRLVRRLKAENIYSEKSGSVEIFNGMKGFYLNQYAPRKKHAVQVKSKPTKSKKREVYLAENES